MKTTAPLFAIFLFSLSACGEVIAERQSTVEVNGFQFPVRTQTVRTGGRTYDVSRVRVNSVWRQCDISLRGDCEGVVTSEILSRGFR